MVEYRIYGVGPAAQEVDLPEARWQFHVVARETAWGIDEHGRYDPVKLHLDRADHRVKVTWPAVVDVPEDIRSTAARFHAALSPSPVDPR